MRFLSRLAIVGVLLATVYPAPVVGATAPEAPAAQIEDVAPFEQSAASVAAAPLLNPLENELLNLTNADRANYGLPPAEFDVEALQVARERAAAQLESEVLSHYDANGDLAFASLLNERGMHYLLAGENLARAYGNSPAVAHQIEQALMNSPLHRDNILEPSFNRLAVGVVEDGNGRVAFAQIFRATP